MNDVEIRDYIEDLPKAEITIAEQKIIDDKKIMSKLPLYAQHFSNIVLKRYD